MGDDEMNAVTERIIGCAYAVANELGNGFLEKVYENAMRIELRKKGLTVECQKPLTVFYDGQAVGDYFADLFVDSQVIVELKTAKCIDSSNYLRASKKRVGLILNFGQPKVEIKRMLNGFS